MLTNVQPPSLIRILAAVIYDLLILFFGIFMISGFIIVSLNQLITGEESIPADAIWLPLLLQLIAFAYYGLSWKRARQTIGMKAWRLYLVSSDNQQSRLIWQFMLIRFFVAQVSALMFGAGFLMALFHPQKRTLHDLMSQTHLVYRPKSVNAGK